MATFAEHDGGIWLPDDAGARVERESPSVLIDNQTGLPDEALLDFFEENTAAFGWSSGTRYQTYQAQGSMLGRAQTYRPPANVIDEIAMARDLAERDDDIAPTLDGLIATALAEGLQNQHTDEQVEHTFDKISEDMGLVAVFAEMLREWLIAGQVTTVNLFVRATYDIWPEGVARVLSRSVASPRVGVLPAEQIRVIGNDLFGEGELAFMPQGKLAAWLYDYFADTTSAAKQRELRMQDPVAAALFTRRIQTDEIDDDDTLPFGGSMYALNPQMTARSTMPRGMWKYPRPPLTRNLPLLEAKRLLNIMDHALLQGGTNYIIVAKKGSDAKPALGPEIENLREVVKRASRQGVLVGDHRVSLEIVTPDLTELLNPTKRRMLGRKLAMGLLRVPEFGSDETGQSVQTFTELVQRVVTADRNAIRDHLHANVWTKTMTRNRAVFGRVDRPTIWLPKVILQGVNFFSDYLLKMYDRGDLPRRYMVEFGGFNYEAVKAQKEREVENGHDDVFTPPPVPFSSPNQGPGDPYQYGNPSRTPGGQPSSPNDNGGGRPPGSGPNNGAPNAQPSRPDTTVRPRRMVRRTRGETVRAFWSDEDEQVVRIGEHTEHLLEHFPDCSIGRMTGPEQRAIDATSTYEDGNIIVVPVSATDMTDHHVVRLDDDFSVICGNRDPDGAILARALIFRRTGYSLQEAEDAAIRFGFPVELAQDGDGDTDAPPDSDADDVVCPSCGSSSAPGAAACPQCGYDGGPFHPQSPPHVPEHHRHHSEPIAITINAAGADGRQIATRRIVERGASGEIVGVREEAITDDPYLELVLAFGKTKPGKYLYLKCPECGLIQDAAHGKCSRCGHDLTEARKAMFATYEKKGEQPTFHDKPPPPASEQPDLRKVNS